MTDRHEPDRDQPRPDEPRSGEPGFEPDFDEPGHAWVRELLADARVATPVPDEVAARLDDTLATLRARRAAAAAADEEAPSVVVPLRQRLRPALVAAASVVAIVGGGVMVGQFAGSGSQNADTATSGVAADRESGGSGSEYATPGAPGAVAGEQPKTAAALPQLTTASFAADAARVMLQVARTGASDAPEGDASRTPDTTDNLTGGTAGKQLEAPPVTATPRSYLRGQSACAGPTIPDAVSMPATLDGAQVALVFRSPTDAGQVVEAWSCDGSALLASATVAR